MRIEKASSTVFTPLDDGTAVLLNLDTRLYYTLNRTGAYLWEQIESERGVTLDSLIRSTVERFDVDETLARRTLTDFIQQLGTLKMVRIA
jgi:hypothetical protein